MRSAFLLLVGPAFMAGCSEGRVWLAPPASPLQTALIQYSDDSVEGALAYDLTSGAALVMPELARDAKVEAALFSQSIGALGMVPGPVTRSTIERPLRARNALEFFRLPLDVDEPRWTPTDALSASFTDFPLPVRRPDEACPSFEQEVIVLEEPAFLTFGTEGPSDSVILSGYDPIGAPRVYQLERSGSFQRISVSPSFGLTGAFAVDGEGFWASAEYVYSGSVRAGTLELSLVGAPLDARVRELAGAATSSTGLYVLTSERAGPSALPRRIHHFDGRIWEPIADIPTGSEDGSLAFGGGELVSVNDSELSALHILGGEMTRRALPTVATHVRYVPDFGFVAGHRADFLRYSGMDQTWRVLAPSPVGATRVRGLTAYEEGFAAIYESAIVFWSPKLGAFCPLIDIAWSDLTFAEVLGQDVFVYSRSDSESASIRVYALRRIVDPN